MWFFERALIAVDTRSAAVAVYRQTLSGPRLLRFAFERFDSRGSGGAVFSEVAEGAKDAVARMVRDLKAPLGSASLSLPLGAAFPAVVDIATLHKARTAEVAEADLVRFHLAPLLPFPIAQAEVRMESQPSLGSGVVLAQAILKTTIAETEKAMTTLGFSRVRVVSTLSAALRGLPPRSGCVDLILGDSASAVAVRGPSGVLQAVHLRLLVEGDDRAQRSIDEAARATSDAVEIRVLGDDVGALRHRAGDTRVVPAFDEPTLRGAADPQLFPFLGVFHSGRIR